MSKQRIYFQDLGQIAYKDAWDYQEKLLSENVAIKGRLRKAAEEGEPTDGLQTTHHLLFVEHPPVYTLGKSGDPAHVLLSEENLAARGIEYFQTNRGGDITYHGPGQLVGYPILDLEHFYTDIGRYLRNVEEVVIRTLADYGLKGERSAGETGVWLDPDKLGKARKICAIGVRSSRWVTMHGFALNVNTDMDYFSFIIPCGIVGKQVTSLEKELGHAVDAEEVKQKVRHYFEEIFEAELVEADRSLTH
ncbi:MAG: lipoyl(octanoyl) transferase LipB [Sphingobacteriales bacterium]|jgi:lipoyl(octanoyl) transferase|nr:lipoyl(octanoyl) transferase LipB [Sphingobacteriales bacterium]OJW33805.1 MAG: lipoyl(octanoyl) transferase [Sphingobacteriales bacterium 46-32]